MTTQELLEKGYFAKELPPPFQTKIFSDKLGVIEKDWNKVVSKIGRLAKADKDIFKEKFRESKWVIYSIPKIGFSRRLLGLPNPYHQAILSKSISAHWKDIEKIFNKSTISSSKPIPDTTNKRALQTIHSFDKFKKERIINSYDKLFEVRSDVSRYYPTIYTHIIPWVIHGKVIAKTNRTDLSLLGNLLDKNSRDGNAGQTLGIPIGPDTSLVIAEIIGCTLDEILQNKFKTVKAFRYYDDYYIYCDNQSVSEKVFKFLQGLLTEYQLDINEEKTQINKSPIPFDSHWAIELGSFTFRKTKEGQQTDLERFVSLAFKHAKENPKDSVLRFAIKCIKQLPLFDESWELYQSLVLKIGLTEPVTLDDIASILVSHRKKVAVSKVKNVVEAVIEEHTPKGHHFEVSWALWICKEFGFKLPDRIARLVFNSQDVASILIGLDLKKNKQINSTVSTSNIEIDLTPDSLMNEKWLLTYEAILKKWVRVPKTNPIDTNEYFELLKKHSVTFYDDSSTLSPMTVKTPKIFSSQQKTETNVKVEYESETSNQGKKTKGRKDKTEATLLY